MAEVIGVEDASDENISVTQSYEKRKVMRSIFCFLYFSFCFLISLLITYFFKYYF